MDYDPKGGYGYHYCRQLLLPKSSSSNEQGDNHKMTNTYVYSPGTPRPVNCDNGNKHQGGHVEDTPQDFELSSGMNAPMTNQVDW